MTFIPKRTEKDFFTFLPFLNFAPGNGEYLYMRDWES